MNSRITGVLVLITLLAGARAARAVDLFGLVDTGELFVSPDGGVTWSDRSTLPIRDAAEIAAGASSEELFLASRSGHFFHSGDAGLTWTLRSAIPVPDLVALCASATGIVLITETGSVYRSLDEGFAFAEVGAIQAPDIASAVPDEAALFALSSSGTVFRSEDEGETWSAVGVLPPTTEAIEITAHTNALFALTAAGELVRSADLGVSWSTLSTLSQVGMTGMVASTSEILATTAGGEIAATPTGTGWTWRGAIGQLTVRALGTDIPTTSGVPEQGSAPRVPAIALAPPWPNPARGVVRLAIDVTAPAAVAIAVFDAAGRRVAVPMAERHLGAGRHQHAWHPVGLARGEYWIRAESRSGVGGGGQKLVWLGR
jgi:photosystem II stability/assembly factor-like uncharacterized protein